MKAKRIAEITADIVKLKEQISQLSAELIKEHGGEGAAAMIAQAIIAREIAKVAMLNAELSAVISTPEKESSDQLRKKQAQKDKEYLIKPRQELLLQARVAMSPQRSRFNRDSRESGRSRHGQASPAVSVSRCW